MDIEAAVESIWQHTLRRSYFPAGVEGAAHDRAGVPGPARAPGPLAGARRAARGLEGRADGAGDPEAVRDARARHGLPPRERPPRHAACRFRHADLIQPGFENELCLTVGTRLEGAHVTRAQARAAVTAVQPAFEIIETRGDFRADVTQSLTDNCQQKAFVTGPAEPAPAGLGARRHDGRGVHQRPAGRPRGRQRGDRASPRRGGVARQEALASSADGSSPASGSCRARSRSSTRIARGTGSRPSSCRSGACEPRSTDGRLDHRAVERRSAGHSRRRWRGPGALRLIRPV